MNSNKLIIVLLLCFYGCANKNEPNQTKTMKDKIVIAHRGASGYLPEHTLASKAMAYAMRPHYLEQDLVLSKDNIPMVIHDIHLETVTNVAEVFPSRNRDDGRFYVIDFAYAELIQLEVTERFYPDTKKAVYPRRFPVGASSFRLHSLQEELELIQGLNKSTTNTIGIYPEIKEPAFHRNEGKDISEIVLKVLSDYGFTSKSDLCRLQCFDASELKRIRQELQSELFLVQLLETKVSTAFLADVTTYADAIGPWYKALDTNMVQAAHDHGLKVHAYTFRADDLQNFQSFNALLDYGFNTLNLDGIFTDFPDKAVSFLQNQ